MMAKRCQLETDKGRCKRLATVEMGGMYFCNQHAKQVIPLFRKNVKITTMKKD